MPLNDLVATGGGTQLCGRECREVEGARSCGSPPSLFQSAARRVLDDAAHRAVEVALEPDLTQRAPRRGAAR